MKFGEAQVSSRGGECRHDQSVQMLAIGVYCVMFVIGLVLNLTSLYHLVRRVLSKQSRNKNRMTILLINLAVADLMVGLCTNIT